MRVMGAELLVASQAGLAEGPIWDAQNERLVWVDIARHELHSLEVESMSERLAVMDDTVGCVALRTKGGFVAAVGTELSLLSDDWTEESRLPLPDEPRTNRTNDGKCDMLGRLWVGTVARDGTPHAGSLFRVSPTGEPSRVLHDLSISNGIGWSLDDRTMYFVDSPTRRIDALEFDLEGGELGRREVLVQLDPGDGLPDGLTVDAAGCVWAAIWGTGQVRRYTPKGAIDMIVEVPVDHVTSCTFGGANYRTLFITTAGNDFDLGGEPDPLAGAIFACQPGPQGRAPALFAG